MTSSAERMADLLSAIRLFEKLARLARESANSEWIRFFPEMRAKLLKKANIREKAAARLSRTLAKECDKLKAQYEPKVWGGQLLGWTTQREVDALEKSIKTDW